MEALEGAVFVGHGCGGSYRSVPSMGGSDKPAFFDGAPGCLDVSILFENITNKGR